ncbi:hypothetical protein BJV78DRAFT_1286710 [Lactifluus subvellereus]|nr:hypothetical protein BJV78DRAFT_1286710 [Lactifluus subvellereus]
MSEAAHEAINAGAIYIRRGDLHKYVIVHSALPPSTSCSLIAGHRNVPQSAQNPTRQGQSNFSDGSGPLFNMYVKMAEEEDNKLADRWQKDADGILIFLNPHHSPVLPPLLPGDRVMPSALLDILRSVPEFDIQNTLPGLQNDFCASWNEIVLEEWKTRVYNFRTGNTFLQTHRRPRPLPDGKLTK